MSKIGKNKKRCEQYKLSGHKEINKKLKQEKAAARAAHFAKRAEEGKTYTYDAKRTAVKLESGDRKNYNASLGIWESNFGSNRAAHTEMSRWRSTMRKLDNKLAQIAAEEKEKETKTKKRGK